MSALAQSDLYSFLHVDLNSFFASVEQQLHPEYRGRPTGVVPTLADTTSLIAASYEAKALGIKTGTRVLDAKRICPNIILVNGNHSTYAEYSHKIVAAVERVCPVAHTPSIDEMVCQLIGRERNPAAALQISLDIKQAIRADVGETLRCSIGMAPNRYLAKIASDMQKPDGLVGLLPSGLPDSIRSSPAARPSRHRRQDRNPSQRQEDSHHASALGTRPRRHASAIRLRLGRSHVPLASR